MKHPHDHPLSHLSRTTLLLLLMLAFVAGSAAAQVPSFSKTFVPSTIGPGSVSTLRFDITNGSSSPVRNLAFTDTLPAGMTIASPAQATATCVATVSAPDGGNTISFSSDGLGGSSGCTITVDVTGSTAGTYTNVSGDLTSDAGNSGSATATLTVADDRPGFTKAFSPSSVSFGGRSTLTFTIDNTANANAAYNMSFSDSLPSGMVVASPANATTTCSNSVLSATAGGDTITLGFAGFNLSSVSAGGSCTVSVDVLGNAVGPLGNTSGELSTSPQFGGFRSSGKAAAVLNVTADRLSLIKSFTDDPVPPGSTVTLAFTLYNLDRSSSASSIAFTDDLDATLSGLTAISTPVSNPCGAGSSLSGTSVLSLTGASLGPADSCTFSVTLQVPAGASAGNYSNTTSQVTGDLGGRPVTGSAASDILAVSAVPTLTKTFLDNPVGAGDSTTLELTITNTSQTFPATDISFVDEFDINLPTASATPGSDFCGVGSTATYTPLTNPTGFDATPARLQVSNASLEPGESCTFSITLDVSVGAPTGTYTNTTSDVTATVNGETVTGSPASDDLQVVSAPQLTKEFIDDPATPGGTVTLQFTLTHDENAPGDATSIAFTDDLDATLSGLVATGLPQSDVCGVGSQLSGTSTLSFTGGSLAPGASCTFNVSLQVPAAATPGSYTNTTSTVVADVLGVTAMKTAATDDLKIAGLTLTKEFTDDPVLPGGTVTLHFTIDNINPTADATDIYFTDRLGDALSGLVATGLPANDVCGTGSSLSSISGGSQLIFQGGNLTPGTSCSFDVSLDVPVSAEDGTYVNRTTDFRATVDGNTVLFDNATDVLTVDSNYLALTKEFIDDPAAPGGTVTLELSVTNLSSTDSVADIAFTDDLDAALSGLVSASGTLSDVCGVGSQVSGTSTLSLTGGTLPAGGSCVFDVTLNVPSSVDLGQQYVNTTSSVTGTIGGASVYGTPASDTLQIDFITFTKSFGGDTSPGGTVTLTFHIENLDPDDPISGLRFTDDLDAVIPGLSAIGLPQDGVCGEGSSLDGTTFLSLSQGSLLPGGSCTFSVTLQVPGSASGGTFVNTTSDLYADNLRVADPASDALTVVVVVDSDGDGVLDDVDVCPGTVIPEGVPTDHLGVNHFALVDGDFVFDTTPPKGKGPQASFTTDDTAGCSCEQIIAALHLGKGHEKFGCSLGAMRNWVDLVNP